MNTDNPRARELLAALKRDVAIAIADRSRGDSLAEYDRGFDSGLTAARVVALQAIDSTARAITRALASPQDVGVERAAQPVDEGQLEQLAELVHRAWCPPSAEPPPFASETGLYREACCRVARVVLASRSRALEEALAIAERFSNRAAVRIRNLIQSSQGGAEK